MNLDTLVAILNKADPQHNSNYQERQVALNMAHRVMDSSGLSYASLGFSQEQAERIEQQFSVSTGHEKEGSHRTGYKGQWWNPFSWGRGQQESTSNKQEQEYEESQSKQQKGCSSGYHSYNDPSSSDYQYQVDYEVISDYQGAVPYWDGS